MDTPLVSVVMATYNRSNVLKLAIQSVLWQTYANWELWVIGDACTDDTEQVVAAFADSRIHFHNLPVNVGEQSGPNNEGVRRATGDVIAFLNHDDLWWPDHLARSLATLKDTGADMVFALTDRIGVTGRRRVDGLSPDGRFAPGKGLFVGCSSWLIRRETVDSVGPWRPYRELYTVPSQDWLFRAFEAGKDIRVSPWLTLIALSSAKRPGSYANRDDAEHVQLVEQIRTDPTLRERELTELLFAQRRAFLRQDVADLSLVPARRLLTAVARRAVRRVLGWLHIDPEEYKGWRWHKRRGEFIDRARQIRGLDRIDAKAIDTKGARGQV